MDFNEVYKYIGFNIFTILYFINLIVYINLSQLE